MENGVESKRKIQKEKTGGNGVSYVSKKLLF